MIRVIDRYSRDKCQCTVLSWEVLSFFTFCDEIENGCSDLIKYVKHTWGKNRDCTILVSLKVNIWYDHLYSLCFFWISHRSVLNGLRRKKTHPSENGQVQGLGWKCVQSKTLKDLQKTWKTTCSRPLQTLQETLSLQKQNIKILGLAQDFCTALYWWICYGVIPLEDGL